MLLYLPARQGLGVVEPVGQYDPVEHGWQAMAPVDDTKEPATHGVHSAAPVAALIDPGEHGVGAVEPVGHAWPALHARHWDAS